MASNLLKDMGNKESLNSAENDGGSAVVESSEANRIQERAGVAGMDKNDQSFSKGFKYDTGVHSKPGLAQFPKSSDGSKAVTDTGPQWPLAGHPGFIQDVSTAKDFLQNYASMQQPMFAASGYANGGSAFSGPMIPPMLVQQPMQMPVSVPGMFQTGFMYQAQLPEFKPSYPKSHYFPPFTKGSLIMLSAGGLKPIEDLKTADFIESAEVSKQLSLETCKIAKIQDVPNSTITLIGFAVENYEKEVLVEKPSDHPFFVYNQGWASCKPDATLAQYGLPCQQLKVGDVCVFLSDRIDGRSDTSTGLEGKTATDDGVGRKPAAFDDPSKFLAMQTANGKELLSRDGQQNGSVTEKGCKATDSSFDVEKSDDNSFGQPAVKKAKLDVMAGKNTQDNVTN